MSLRCFDRCEVVAVLEGSGVVEPVDPFGGGELEVVEALPGPLGLDEFGLVEPDHGLGQRVVIGRGAATWPSGAHTLGRPCRMPEEFGSGASVLPVVAHLVSAAVMWKKRWINELGHRGCEGSAPKEECNYSPDLPAQRWACPVC